MWVPQLGYIWISSDPPVPAAFRHQFIWESRAVSVGRCVCDFGVVNKNRMPKMPRFRDFGDIPLSFLPSFLPSSSFFLFSRWPLSSPIPLHRRAFKTEDHHCQFILSPEWQCGQNVVCFFRGILITKLTSHS